MFCHLFVNINDNAENEAEAGPVQLINLKVCNIYDSIYSVPRLGIIYNIHYL